MHGLLCALFLSFTLFSHATPSEEELVKRVHGHLLVQDLSSAFEEASQAVSLYTTHAPLWEMYIKVLARMGNEKEMMMAWQRYIALCPAACDNRSLLESMAWGVIEKGSNSSSILMRIMGLLGAFFGQDAKGIDILCTHLQDPNAYVRNVAVQLSSRLHDAKLCEVLLRLLREEKHWDVRLEVIKAVGRMKISLAKPDLITIIANDRSTAEEKAAAIESLVHLLDTADRAEVAALAHSQRVGLRLLACEAVLSLGLDRDLDLIYPLLSDHCGTVRAAALTVMGILRVEKYQDKPMIDIATSMLEDPDYTVAITAAWLATLHHPSKGQKAFERWLNHRQREVRLMAAAALGACGKYGFPLTREVSQKSADSYVRMNLAMTCLSQRVDVEGSCRFLHQQLMQHSDRWMWRELAAFRALAPSSLREREIENPDEEHQLVQLEILNLIAMMKYPHAQEMITQYLEQKSWGVTGVASALLLTECDALALDLVKNLLDNACLNVRVQAALVLAMWGREPQALAVLREAYSFADRALKEKILEGIGHIGDQSTIPFLIEKLDEPFPSLRLIAASSLLQCLYH